MYLKKESSLFGTVTFRLTLWYAVFFGGLSLMVFLVVYVSLISSLDQRTDKDLLSTAKEFEELYTSRGIDALRSEFQREATSRGVRRVFFRLLSPHHEVIAASDLTAWSELKAVNFSSQGKFSSQGRLSSHEGFDSHEELDIGVIFSTLKLPARRHRVRVVSGRMPDGHVLQLGMTLKDDEMLMEKYRETFGAALAVMLICGGVVGWLLARWSMSGVERVTQTAVRIGKGDLSLRVPLSNEGREIKNLACAFNEMLERIEALVRELKEVINNVAHDLRSPITCIRGLAESALLDRKDLKAYRQMAGAVIEESDRLVEMINTMLEIAQAESGVLEITRSLVDVRQIIKDAQELFLPVAEDKLVRLDVSLPSEPLTVLGDVARLQRVVANILDNAIKYTPAHGRVIISADSDASGVSIAVRDTGPGIDQVDLPYIFDRFYRGEKSRSSPGNGLGLSLALAIIRMHGGDIAIKSLTGKGSTFTVCLPRDFPQTIFPQ